MSNILSQEEVDALLRGISGGAVETEADVYITIRVRLCPMT